MTISEIVIGDRVLVQTSESVKEIAYIKEVNEKDGLVIVKMSNGDITDIAPQYIIKSFGQ